MPLRLIAVTLGLLLPVMGSAQMPIPCPVGSALPCGTVTDPTGVFYGFGAEGLGDFLRIVILQRARIAIIALLLIMFTVYAARLLVQADEENTVTDIKNAYSQAIVGAVVISISWLISQAFGQNATTNATLVNSAPATTAITNVTDYFRVIVGILLSVLVTTQGIRLILLQGEESEIEQQRKKFFHSLLGVAVILLVDTILSKVIPDSGTSNTKSSLISAEIVGIINFSLVLLGALAVLSFIIAGVLLIVSTDESLKDRAKKTVFGTVVSLVIVFSSYILVNYFISL